MSEPFGARSLFHRRETDPRAEASDQMSDGPDDERLSETARRVVNRDLRFDR